MTKRKPELGNWQLKEITPALIESWEALFREGATRKEVARKSLVPFGIVKRWLEEGAEAALEWYEQGGEGQMPLVAQLHLKCEAGRGEFVAKLRGMLVAAGAGKESSPGSAGWMLERLEQDEWGLSQKLEISGPEGGPLIVDERHVVGWADFFAIAEGNGYLALLGLPGGGARGALPAPAPVLPDPAEHERSADAPPGVSGS